MQLSLKRQVDLTIEGLRALDIHNDYSDAQLAVLLDTIKRYTKIIFEISEQQFENNASLLKKYNPQTHYQSGLEGSEKAEARIVELFR